MNMQRQHYYKTTDIARAVGCHPNTVRRFEASGFIASVPRNPRNGYRRYSEVHLRQMQLARLALQYPYPGGKAVVLACVYHCAAGRLGDALQSAYQYRSNIRAEIVQAQAAVDFVERWSSGTPLERISKTLNTSAAARLLGLSSDTLRNWERNGLLRVPRNPANGYRQYGRAEVGRLRVIRMLREAGYSMMAILRLLNHLDIGGGEITQGQEIARVLDTPSGEEDFLSIADQWLTTLHAQEERAQQMILQLEATLAEATS
ncbi:MAG: MerR family transcriptional regulator [Anaerolineae bacterium]|nr:MerR family transcriptional regulator [Anaerolineae bacterium]